MRHSAELAADGADGWRLWRRSDIHSLRAVHRQQCVGKPVTFAVVITRRGRGIAIALAFPVLWRKPVAISFAVGQRCSVPAFFHGVRIRRDLWLDDDGDVPGGHRHHARAV